MKLQIDEVFTRSLAQLTRLLRCDGAVLYAYIADMHMLWPLKRHGDSPDRVPPVLPGAHLVGEAFDSPTVNVVDEQQIAAVGEAWLQAKAAKTVVAIPLRHGSERFGVVVLWSQRALDVDEQTLRAVAVFSSELAAAVGRAPMFVISDMQRHQIEAMSRIIAAASRFGFSDEAVLYRIIAREAQLLTGADSIAFVHPSGTRTFTSLLSRRSHRPLIKVARTVLRSRLTSYDLTIALSWRERFTPSEQLSRSIGLISNAVFAVEGLRASEAAADRERRSQYVGGVGRALAVSLDLSVLFVQIQALLVPTSADWVVVDVFSDEEGARADIHHSATVSSPDRLRSSVHELSTQTDHSNSETIQERFDPDAEGLAEMVIVPLMSGGRRIGAIGFGRSAARVAAGITDRSLYEELSSYVAAAIGNATTFGKEQHVADILQQALLPTVLPIDDRAFFDAAYAPAASEAQIGGDWYEVFALDEDRFAVSIGDVAGHGMRAAATMNVVRLAFRAAALSESDPHRVLERADAVLHLEEDAPMVTAIYGIVDLRRYRFSYASAGHLPPLLVQENGTISTLPTHGIPMGVWVAGEAPLTFECDLHTGDTLVLYTDGLIEYDRDVISGERRLQKLLGGLIRAGTTATLARDLRTATFEKGVQQNDDVAVLSISLRPPNRRVRHEMNAVLSSVPVARHHA